MSSLTKRFRDWWDGMGQKPGFGEAKRIFAVILFTIVYSIGLSWFINSLDPIIYAVTERDGELVSIAQNVTIYTGGVGGVGQLIRDLVRTWTPITLDDTFLAIFIFVFNIPLFILGWFGVSKRFTIYSLISVLIQSTMIGFIPKISFGLEQEPLTTAIIGGLLIGIGTGGALRFGTSTGGFDIIAQYLSIKKSISFGIISLSVNFTVCFIGGIVLHSPITIAYTTIRLIACTMVTDKVHTAYQYQGVQIITTEEEKIVDCLLHKLERGVTLMRVTGAYSHIDKTMVYVVISSYELHSLLNMIHGVDTHSFVTTIPIKNVYGSFKHKTIA
jgi:uncharacterized membrane-anchored protein YitT (DUF2179 family)